MGPAKFVGFCFMLFAAFGAGFYYSEYAKTEPFVAYAKTTGGETEVVAPSELVNLSGDYCAILTMPRSYVPLLERLKRQRIKDVVITPARIESQDGRITAVAEKSGYPAKSSAARQDDSVQTEPSGEKSENSSIFGAMAVYFLAGSKNQKAP